MLHLERSWAWRVQHGTEQADPMFPEPYSLAGSKQEAGLGQGVWGALGRQGLADDQVRVRPTPQNAQSQQTSAESSPGGHRGAL